jgi:hypothetical protein
MEEISREEIESIDKLYFTPGERASNVWWLLNDVRDHLRKQNEIAGRDPEYDIPSDFDILCFAIEFAGSMSLMLQHAEFTLKVIEATKYFYGIHYTNPQAIYGEPDRPQESET